MEPLLTEINVWKRIDEHTLARYRCFQLLPQNRFCVQSVDFYRPLLDESQIRQFDKQHLELLLEESPELRAGDYETLEDAITAHDQEFGH